MELFDNLNEAQKRAVQDTEGYVLVFAGAGSGKTRVLTSRIAYLVKEKGVSYKNILAITFTNKAAKEMKERLSKFFKVEDTWICTIHSMCVKILKRNAHLLGYTDAFTIYDDEDKNKALKRILRANGFDPKDHVEKLSDRISQSKNENMFPEQYYHEYGIEKYYVPMMEEYDRNLKDSNAFDFDDILFKTSVLLKSYPNVLSYYQDIFRYIHVDEFQDTNKVQMDIIRELSDKHHNLFVVGDDDQSIYSWRGAKIENILNFQKEFKNAKTYILEENYRSTQNILDVANNIIRNNETRVNKNLFTDKGKGVKVEYKQYDDDTDEAYNVARKVLDLVSLGYKLSDMAVLMRINATSRSFENVFRGYDIDYRIFGGVKFFDRKEVKDALAYLKLICNENDIESFARIINLPKRGIGDSSVSHFFKFLSAKKYSLNEGIININESPLNAATKLKIVNFMNDIQEFRVSLKDIGMSTLAQTVIDHFGLKKQYNIKDPDDKDRIEHFNELVADIKEFEVKNPSFDLPDYLQSISLVSDTDTIKEGGEITIATIHAVKGLEFKVVFIIGVEDGLLPMRRDYSLFALEEERRLMYVGVTRAEERLYLSSARSRFRNGKTNYTIRSPFIDEGLPKKKDSILFEDETFEKPINSNRIEETPIQDYSKFKIGTKVKHPSFGNGMVVKVSGSGISAKIDVAFEKKGIVTLAVSVAPLEII